MNSNDAIPAEEKEAMMKALFELIAIPSVKSAPSDEAPFGTDTVRALTQMLDLGAAFGFSTKCIDNKVGYIEWGTDGPITAILCHLDVVPAQEGWQHDPFTLRREGNNLVGRGVIDDKGPAVCSLFAMKRLKDSGFCPAGRIRLILGLDEESGSLCMQRYKETEELPRIGFTPDASFPPIYAEKGILRIRVFGKSTNPLRISAGERANMVPAKCSVQISASSGAFETIGIPAHASTPQFGVNAISLAIEKIPDSIIFSSPLLSFYRKYIGKETNGASVFGREIKDSSGALTLNAGILQMDSVSEQLWIDIRYPVSENGEALFSAIKILTDSCSLKAELLSHDLPLNKDPHDPLITSLLSVYQKYAQIAYQQSGPHKREFSSYSPLPVAIGGGTYARSMPGLVAFGPAFPWDKDQAHCVDESISEENFYLLTSIYEDAIRSLSESIK